MAYCDNPHDTVPKKDIARLPTSQAAEGRHRCALCAYELGRHQAGEAEQRLRERVRALVAEVDGLKKKLEDLTK
jgi:hypothetical protein